MTILIGDVTQVIAERPGALPNVAVAGWSIDSRTLQAGDLFFALRGPVHDGHKYVDAAFAKGAVAAVVERAAGQAREIRVKDTLAALQTLASWARQKWGGKVIGVTGSAGKTTTKDVIAHLLASQMEVGKTVGNLNNHFGVPLSILRLPDGARVAVLEMGMNHAGEIRELARMAAPDIGVVTNVGYAHTENFASIDDVALAKRELIDGLRLGGTAVLNADDPRVAAFRQIHAGPVLAFGFAENADVRAEEPTFGPAGARFRCGGVWFESPLAGRHGVSNVLAGLAVARLFDITPEKLRDAVRTLATGRMRGERQEKHGAVLLNDCYNSNPEAARAMLDVLRETPAERRVAVLGEMLELGSASEELHRGVGRYAVERGMDIVVGIRGDARYIVDEARRAGVAAHFFDDSAAAGDFVRELIQPGDAILFKGSRGVQVERALEKVMA
jgi:UDP-N-acetylmuramoyl-tripeptide--D-alanyl-D-alanine ligase